jgi:hypothetical protein
MLLGAGDGNEPALSPGRPQLINRDQVGRRIIECARSDFDFVRAVYDREHRRSARGTKVAIVGRQPPALSFTRDQNAVCLPDGEKVAD